MVRILSSLILYSRFTFFLLKNHSILTLYFRDRLESTEEFRNGEINFDDLCAELQTNARCSESGVVVDQKDVDDIISRAK